MKPFLPALVALAATAAMAATPDADQAPVAAAPASAASAPADCTRVATRTVVVNGKAVQVHKREHVPDCTPRQAKRLWD